MLKAELSPPIDVLHGHEAGPTIWLYGAIHGDETVGVEIIPRVAPSVSDSAGSGGSFWRRSSTDAARRPMPANHRVTATPVTLGAVRDLTDVRTRVALLSAEPTP